MYMNLLKHNVLNEITIGLTCFNFVSIEFIPIKLCYIRGVFLFKKKKKMVGYARKIYSDKMVSRIYRENGEPSKHSLSSTTL